MTHTYKTAQRTKILGATGAISRKILSTSHSSLFGRKRNLPNRCGLFSGTKPEARPATIGIDIDDDDAFLNFKAPKIESQISVLSTDSGILPSDIRNSSFVDDVIGELASQGICHTDIICESAQPEPSVVVAEAESRKRKATSPLQLPILSPDSITDDQIASPHDHFYSSSSNAGDLKRQKNNEASRKSRANRKYKNSLKETEIATLEEENLRLNVLLKDFNQVAATCKRWLVQRMENPAEF